MDPIKTIKTYFLSVFVFLLLMSNPKASAFAQTRTSSFDSTSYSTWIWDSSTIVKEDKKIISFLSNKEVTSVYLQINRDIPMNVYQRFVEEASNKGIKVAALEGSPNWLDPSNNRRTLFFSWLKKYQAISNANQQFSAVHLDIEPYLYKNWKLSYQNTIKQYQTIIQQSHLDAKKLNIPLQADIPFWFDGTMYSNSAFGKGSLSNWIINNTDKITIMAYRDTLLGLNGILNLTKNELNYGSRNNKKVEIGLETMALPNQDSLTFFEEGENYMNKQIASLANADQRYSAFDGVAIHSYESWVSLKR
jgi:hypothetical protein